MQSQTAVIILQHSFGAAATQHTRCFQCQRAAQEMRLMRLLCCSKVGQPSVMRAGEEGRGGGLSPQPCFLYLHPTRRRETGAVNYEWTRESSAPSWTRCSQFIPFTQKAQLHFNHCAENLCLHKAPNMETACPRRTFLCDRTQTECRIWIYCSPADNWKTKPKSKEFHFYNNRAGWLCCIDDANTVKRDQRAYWSSSVSAEEMCLLEQ